MLASLDVALTASALAAVSLSPIVKASGPTDLVPYGTLWSATAETRGASLTGFTVNTKDDEALETPSRTVNVIVVLPD
jgi:hypothetical protein